MALTKQKFTSYLKAADFRTLFIEEMGWNKVNASFSSMPTFYAGETSFEIKAIAHRNGFQVLQCPVEELPSNATCKKLDIKLRKAANDYICIFIIPGTEHHQWVAPIKINEKRDIVIIEYAEAEKAQFLFEKIAGLSFDIDEVTTIVDVKERVQGAFAINSEKITKDFYSGFNKEHKAFAEFISGIDDQIETKKNKNKQWYTSVMLNRLMFCYFIQKKGFLDGDENYLRNKLHWTQEQKGKNQFFKSFYRGFLIHLFHEGLNSPKHDDTFEGQYGRIPYLNGGMFDLHQIEQDYDDIDINDEAFESLFEFFDKWRWHLDTRVTASGKDINPDVLGYIFEQYINDRAQMGAYYTKEDITEYIGRNTIIPYLFDSVEKKYPEAFIKDGPFWSFIQHSGDAFIYDAVKKGVSEGLPSEISEGLSTSAPNLIDRRKRWNLPTPAGLGLPTEIWRETIERRKRYDDTIRKIRSCEVKSVNDFITLNLNTPKIAYDFLNTTKDQKFVELFYQELLKITILDPTCGSGAFLFAALNLLEPLYEVCISRMEEFNALDHYSFKEQLAEIQNKYRSNIQYFIYKSIILRNLYGVDIMAEAVEIAKLRLFLKMVAVVEVDRRADNMGLDPLPDVDFNIRCGNTLVGYANRQSIESDLYGDDANIFLVQESEERINEQLDLVSVAYDVFREEQLETKDSILGYKQAKEELSKALKKLNGELNNHMFKASGVSTYSKWKEDYQPFHWIAEFYQIINYNGGFDVIIGNPPYVETSVAFQKYSVTGYDTVSCGNLYACVYERSLAISHENSFVSMIVQLPIACTDRMDAAQRLLLSYNTWSLTFDDRPGKLFDDLEHIRATIFISKKDGGTDLYTTRYLRWYSIFRPILFQCINTYQNDSRRIKGICSLPKVGDSTAMSILHKMLKGKSLKIMGRGSFYSYFHNAPQYFTRATSFIPYFWNEKDGEKLSVSVKAYPLLSEEDAKACTCILNSSVFYWWFILLSDCRHLNLREIDNFPLSLETIDPALKSKLVELCDELMVDFDKHKYRRSAHYKATGDVEYDEYYPKYSKNVIDKIDMVLALHFGLTEAEYDYLINYDIKYRMGDEMAIFE